MIKTAFRLTLLLCSLACLCGWLALRRPYGPTDDLELVRYSAFVLHAPSPEAGHALASAAREWPGVRATTYNASSDLLVAIHTSRTDSGALREKLQELSPFSIVPKTFAATAGPQCPVPHEMLAAVPGLLLSLSLGFAALQCAFEWRSRHRKVNITSVHQTNPSSL